MDVTRRLLEWYRRHARPLSWRREPRDPYLVLVSELMQQQTQVDRVVLRFRSFVTRFPGLQAVAAASEEEVLAEWSGLGYYSRARRLRQLAIELAGRPLPAEPRGAAEAARDRSLHRRRHRVAGVWPARTGP